MFKRMTLFAALLALPTLAWADLCPAYMEMIDDSLEQQQVDAETEEEVLELRDEGEALCEEGDEEAAIQVFDQALALLEGGAGGY